MKYASSESQTCSFHECHNVNRNSLIPLECDVTSTFKTLWLFAELYIESIFHTSHSTASVSLILKPLASSFYWFPETIFPSRAEVIAMDFLILFPSVQQVRQEAEYSLIKKILNTIIYDYHISEAWSTLNLINSKAAKLVDSITGVPKEEYFRTVIQKCWAVLHWQVSAALLYPHSQNTTFPAGLCYCRLHSSCMFSVIT